MYARLLALLLAFLTLAAAGEDDDGAGGDGGGGGDGGDAGGAGDDGGGEDDAGGGDEGGSTSLDDELDDEAGDPPRRADPPETPRERSARERAENAERQLRERGSQGGGGGPGPAGDPDTEREDEQLRAARARNATKAEIDWLQWQINTSREVRASRRESSAALNEAREIQDRTEFSKLELTKPKTFKLYGKRIEDAIADMKSKGQAPLPRMALLRFFIGDDYMKDALKFKKSGKEKAPSGGAPRGKMPGARSDASARGGGNTERDKRRARLENQQI